MRLIVLGLMWSERMSTLEDSQFREEFARRLLEAAAWVPAYGISDARKRIAVECAINLLDVMVERPPPADQRVVRLNLRHWAGGSMS